MQKFKKEKKKKKIKVVGSVGLGQFVCLSLLRSVGTHNRVATGCRGAVLHCSRAAISRAFVLMNISEARFLFPSNLLLLFLCSS